MASIDIFPLAIGGVQPPLNLLTNILTPTASQKNLFYPIDLASNPSYCHAIQFSIFDYDTPNLNEVMKTANNLAASWANQQTKDGKTKLTDSMKSFVKDNSQVLLDDLSQVGTGGALKIKKGNTQAYISLYMPDTLYTSYDSDYTTLSLTETMGMYGIAGGLLADEKLRNNVNKTNLAQNRDAQRLAAEAIGGAAGGIGMQGGGITNLLNRAMKNVPNPQMQLIYKGISLRQFQFEFLFTPVSSQEAKMVDQIIKKFVYFSTPEAVNNDRYLIPPQIFNIKFSYTGSSGLQSAISNVFTNTLSNVLGSQVTAALGPSGPQSVDNGIKNAKLFTIGDCVLTNVTVDYAPNGWAAYSDGYPVQTRLTLQFQEMDIRTKSDVDPDFYASQNTIQNKMFDGNGKTLSQATGSAYTDLLNSPGF